MGWFKNYLPNETNVVSTGNILDPHFGQYTADGCIVRESKSSFTGGGTSDESDMPLNLSLPGDLPSGLFSGDSTICNKEGRSGHGQYAGP